MRRDGRGMASVGGGGGKNLALGISKVVILGELGETMGGGRPCKIAWVGGGGQLNAGKGGNRWDLHKKRKTEKRGTATWVTKKGKDWALGVAKPKNLENLVRGGVCS